MTSNTKTALLDSAERAVRRHGFDGFSYADLAQEVGIRKASIHHHFPTKASLSLAVMQRYAQHLDHACASINTDCTTGGARLTAFVALYRAALEDGQSLCLCVAFSTSLNSLPADVIEEILRFRHAMIDWLTDAFALGNRDGTIRNVSDPRAEAASTLAMLEGAQLAARATETAAPFDQATALLCNRLA